MVQGDSAQLVWKLPENSVDAWVTDPPYSSGGNFRGDREASTAAKYLSGAIEGDRLPDFFGDTRTDRGLLLWASLWLAGCWRATKPGGAIAVFCDWRSLPSFSDALQAGNWSWRGVGVWLKPAHKARPTIGGLRNDKEFVLIGSKGARTEGDCLPGSWIEEMPNYWEALAPDPRTRLHQTEKPQKVLEDLVRLAPPGGLVGDPFAGSGSCGVAALTQGRSWYGIELSHEYAALATRRLLAVETTGADVQTDAGSLFAIE